MNAEETLVQDVLTRHARLKALREPWEPVWKEVTDFVLPRRSIWDLDAEEGQRPSQKIYNSAAVFALNLLATGIVGYAISPAVAWFKLRLDDFDLQALPYVGDWLEDCERRMYAEFNASNFYAQAVEYITDMASIGHATMFIQDDLARRRVRYSTRHPKEIFIANGPDGAVDTVNREFRPTARDVVAAYGKDNVSEKIREDAERNGEKKVRVLHAVFPRKDGQKAGASTKNYISLYIDLEDKKVLEESGFDELPYAVSRWRTNSDEVYARSPSQDALSDILMLNQVTKTRLTLAQLVSDPPYNVPDALRGRERLIPHGYNYFTDPKEIVSPVAVGGNYPMTTDVEQRIEQYIRNHFHVDFFLMLSQATKQMTAREIVERQGEKAAVLGSTLGSINQDYLKPVIERTFAIMMRQGRLSPPPPALLRANANLDIDFIGPLAQAQKKYHQTAGLLQSLELIGPIAQIDPTSLDVIDATTLMREALDAYGMPQKVIREEPEVQKIRAARAQAQAQAKQEQLALMQQDQLLKNVDKLNKKREPGSMLDELEAQAQSMVGVGV